MMTTDLSEEDIRRALFGGVSRPLEAKGELSAPSSDTKRSASISSKIRVILNVTNIFEGDCEQFVYDSSSLSTLVAIMDAKKKYKKFR
jgi:hypothetical protein